MKTIQLLCIVLVAFSTKLSATTKADSLGLPGDNFDLYAALDLFKTSNSPEDFEKAINSKDNELNNLDLDGDGKVDYVKVIDKSKGDAHSLVLQVAVSKTETQDVAVIELEKTADGQAHVQIVGDEELYGKNYIVEPGDSTQITSAPKTANKTAGSSGNVDDVYNTSSNASTSSNYNTADNGNNNNDNSNYNNNGYNNNNYNNNGNYGNYGYGGGPSVMINVWGWPSVQYMYAPAYVGWSSPWYWGSYPGWWSPWQPIYWGYYSRRVYRYHYPYFHRAYQYRCPVAHNYYYGQRTTSSLVMRNNRSGYYNQRQAAYRRTTPVERRYNNNPANPGRNVAGRQAAERNAAAGARPANQPRQAAGQQRIISPQQRSNSPQQRGQVNTQPQARPQAQPRQVTAQPRQAAQPQARPQAQPRQAVAQPRQAVAQPRQASPQPRPQTARPQAAPVQRGGVGGGGGSMPHAAPSMGGRAGGGGGGRR